MLEVKGKKGSEFTGHLGVQMIQWKQALNQETVDLSYLIDKSLTHWMTLSKSLQSEHFSLLIRELEVYH